MKFIAIVLNSEFVKLHFTLAVAQYEVLPKKCFGIWVLLIIRKQITLDNTKKMYNIIIYNFIIKTLKLRLQHLLYM
jgi:hypothetical protein